MSTLPRFRFSLSWLGELVYLVDVMLVAVAVSVLVLAGVNPLESTALTIGLAVSAVIVLAHAVWFHRHRYEIEHDRSRLAARERRGF